MNFAYQLFKKMAFSMDAEKAHTFSLNLLAHYPHLLSFVQGELDSDVSKFELQVGRNRWKFPVGLAAGLDKNGEAIEFFSRIFFGAVEVGTVTPLAQAGNEKPRLFRYIEEESLRNCMGFNNEGAEVLFKNVIGALRNKRPLGINLGKNKLTPEREAPQDYQKLYRKFAKIADYLVVNVSSPNTPGLRDLQKASELEEIFKALEDQRKEQDCPLYLKIAPDINTEDLPSIIEVVKKYKLEGLMATNTTIMPERGIGGVSGKLLYEKAHHVRSLCLDHLKETPEVEFIGIGGFSNFDQMWEYWKSGGRALQIYSAFIFQGPSLLKEIARELEIKMEYFGVSNFEDLLKEIQTP